MPSSCVLKNCKRKLNEDRKISFHKFPFDDFNLFSSWNDFVKRASPNSVIHKNSKICSCHFKPSDFVAYGEKARLIPNSIPSLYSEEDLTMEILDEHETENMIKVSIVDTVDNADQIIENVENVEIKTTKMDDMFDNKTEKMFEEASGFASKCDINVCPIPVKVSYFKDADIDIDQKIVLAEQDPRKMNDTSFSLNIKMCRLCPSVEFLSDLYHPRNLEVQKVIRLLVNIEDESSTKLPKFICKDCEHFVQSIIDFRDKTIERDKKLRALVKSDSKNPNKIENLTHQSPEKEILPIEVLLIKEENIVADESDSFVEYLDDQLDEEESPEQEKKPTKNPKSKPRAKRDSSKRDWQCLFCKNVYSNWDEFNEHKKDHLQCPVCLKTFKTYRLMTRHKTNVHAGDTHCHICGKHILNRIRLLGHIRSVHNKERNHRCEICGAAFFLKPRLTIHMLRHNDPNSEKCDFENCGKMFKSIYHLKNHKKVHFPKPVTSDPKTKPPKTIICQYCGKILKTSIGYEIHKRVHRNEKPFDCPDCDKKFRDKRQLYVHGLSHKNIRPFKCDLCPKGFYTMAVMENHKISVHETEMKHECHICGKRMKMKSNLTVHLKIHGIVKNKDYLN